MGELHASDTLPLIQLWLSIVTESNVVSDILNMRVHDDDIDVTSVTRKLERTRNLPVMALNMLSVV
jgi:hypothetical protein